MNRKLFLKFSTKSTHTSDLQYLRSKLTDITNVKFFLFENLLDKNVVFMTFNTTTDLKNIKDLITIHRKSETNTFYTLNAMNRLISDENAGEFKKNFAIDWTLYRDTVILTGKISSRIIPIRFLDIIN